MTGNSSADRLLTRIKRQAGEMRDVPMHATVPFYMTPREMFALIECAEALKQMRAMMKAIPEMNHMRFDGIGNRVVNALHDVGEI